MKIVSYDFEAVANSEVLKILEERGSASAGDGASILPSERRVQEYLLERATARVEAETMNRFIDAAKEFKLTKKEILQVSCSESLGFARFMVSAVPAGWRCHKVVYSEVET